MIMSDAASARVSLAALARGRGDDAPGFARDARFLPQAERSAIPPEPAIDPVEAAFARGYREGVETGAAAERAAAAVLDAARHRIETALARMDGDETERLAARLRDTVLALCDSVLTEAAIDPGRLAARAAAAAAMFARAQDERVIRLHPEDLTAVHGRLPETWHCEPDSALERGAVRVDTAGGGVEDGPAQWHAALTEALRGC